MSSPSIVLDTSTLIAIAKLEPEAVAFAGLITEADRLILPASGYLEAVLVLGRSQPGRAWVERFVERNAVIMHPITETTARLAADAFERYGRGSGHPARLNFGDCMSYAVAMELDAPLLFKGDDFAHTDVKRAT